MRSVMQHSFSQAPQAEIQRSTFDRSHGLKTTLDSGYLVPIFFDWAYPGDTFNVNLHAFGRMSTPLHPFLDNVFADTFYFAVPFRLIHANFQKMMGEQTNPGDSTDYVTPKIDATTAPLSTTGFTNQSIFDYLGFPTLVAGIPGINSYKLRAYNKIVNDWFRDENLQNSLSVPVGDGPDNCNLYSLFRRGKRYDYFTSSLPWPQKGPAVPLPLTGNAPVYGTGKALSLYDGTSTGALSMNATPVASAATGGFPPNVGVGISGGLLSASKYIGVPTSGVTGLQADLSSVSAATINQLRQAFQLQRFYEKDARGGTRYTEIILSHFGVSSPDSRLQRAEYLGGGSQIINVNPIAQTSSTSSQPTPQGNLAAMGVVNISGSGFTKSFTEHCIILGLVSIRADLNYQQGLDRLDTISTRVEFYWPTFAHLGEQAVLSKEIYCKGASDLAGDATIFGYNERYAELRYKQSRVTGKFRSNDPQTLDSWHLAQNFSSRPTLSDTFIQEQPPISRVVAVPTEPQFLLDTYHTFIAARPMPTYGVPGYIDRF